MQRLSLLDAQFLHLEDRCAPMHIAATCIFEGMAPSAGRLRAHVQSKLARIPRYRQRIRTLPFELGRPVWVDDVHFDIDYHLKRTALPGPCDDRALCQLLSQVLSRRLDRSRPLWELWTVEGLAQGRWALVVKVHHSMVDGVSGVDLLAALLDADPQAAAAEAESCWRPEREPAPASMVQDAWRGLAQDAGQWVRALKQGIAEPERLREHATHNAQGLLRWAKNLTPTPPLSIEGTVGCQRVYAFHVADLRLLTAVRKAAGGTLNDVALAAIAGGYRRYLKLRGDRLEGAKLRTLVPVSVRGADEHDHFDNRVSAVLCELPVSEPDPLKRLRTLHTQMDAHKGSHMAEAGDFLVRLGNLAPPMLVGPVTRTVARVMHSLPQRALNTVTTNVPGPRVPLYLLGRRQLHALPYVPIHQGVRTAVAVLSYDGEVTFGVTGDYDSTPDVKVLADAIGDEINLLVRASGAALSAPAADVPPASAAAQ